MNKKNQRNEEIGANKIRKTDIFNGKRRPKE